MPEVAAARIFAGFHYGFSTILGKEMGWKIGRTSNSNRDAAGPGGFGTLGGADTPAATPFEPVEPVDHRIGSLSGLDEIAAERVTSPPCGKYRYQCLRCYVLITRRRNPKRDQRNAEMAGIGPRIGHRVWGRVGAGFGYVRWAVQGRAYPHEGNQGRLYPASAGGALPSNNIQGRSSVCLCPALRHYIAGESW